MWIKYLRLSRFLFLESQLDENYRSVSQVTIQHSFNFYLSWSVGHNLKSWMCTCKYRRLPSRMKGQKHLSCVPNIVLKEDTVLRYSYINLCSLFTLIMSFGNPRRKRICSSALRTCPSIDIAHIPIFILQGVIFHVPSLSENIFLKTGTVLHTDNGIRPIGRDSGHCNPPTYSLSAIISFTSLTYWTIDLTVSCKMFKRMLYA